MPETDRKHVTIRYIPTFELSYNDDEKAYGAVIPFLPDSSQVRLHDVSVIANQYFASVSIVTEEVVSEEELLAAFEEELEDQEETDAPDPKTPANVIELPKGPAKPRRKRQTDVPPTGGA